LPRAMAAGSAAPAGVIDAAAVNAATAASRAWFVMILLPDAP
jgi:hypothetical protein